MISIFIALGYIKGNIKQTIISIIGISLSISVLAISIGIANGLGENTINNLLYFSPHIKVRNISSNILDYKKELQQIQSLDESIKAFPKCSGKGIIKYQNFHLKYTDGVLIEGIEEEDLKKILKINNKLIEGEIDYKEPSNILIGKELADILKAKVGDAIKIISSENKEMNFNIKGIFFFGFYEYDLNMVIIPLKTAQVLLDIEGTSEINIKLDDIYKADGIAKKIQEKLNLNAKPWTLLNRQLLKGILLEKRVMITLLSLLLLIAAFLVGSLMTSIVRNKKREIGILRALGISKNTIESIFIFISLILSTLGFLLSLVISSIIIFILKKFTFNFVSEVYYIPDKIPFILSIKEYLYISLASLITSLLTSISPSRAAAKLSPQEVLKYE